MKRFVTMLVTTSALGLAALSSPQAQSPMSTPTLLKQATGSAPVLPMPAEDVAQLGDPLFTLVLKDHADVTDLTQLETLLQPDASKRQVFVVSENIATAAHGRRRAVITFSGKNGDQVLASNVMVSAFFNETDIITGIEAWGWDGKRGRYNYYRLDTAGAPHGQMRWKLRMTSDGADMLTAEGRKDTCAACHINGGPVMKELLLPWNNWHSFSSQAAYLTPTGDAATRWAIAMGAQLNGHLDGAQNLEGSIIAPIKQYATQRMLNSVTRNPADGSLAIDADGTGQVLEGKRLLRALFVTTEYNIASSGQKSGLHPLAGGVLSGPSGPVTVPSTFFLNANLIGGGGVLQYKGLGLAQSQQFGAVAQLTPAEYKQLVADAGVKLARQAGDANFAWIVPEPSHMDNALADRLLQTGVVTPEFLAAVQAVDLEKPVFSAERASLLRFVPDQFRFKKVTGDPLQAGRHPDDLTKQVIAAIQASQPAAESVEARFLALLQDPDPKKRLSDQADAYLAREKAQLGNAQTRSAELTRLYQKAIAVRRAALNDETLKTLNESEVLLFPVP